MLGYLGTPVLLEHLLYSPDSSLLKQTVDPQMLGMLNLAGFGLAAWDDASHEPESPFTYRSTQVAIFDRNLHGLARKVRARALIAHVRGVPYDPSVSINEQNLHPFRLDGSSLAVAHNGDLAEFDRMRFELLEYLQPAVARRLRGSTDSEWIHALIVSSLENPTGELETNDILQAIGRALSILRKVRERLGIRRASAVNLVACDGRSLVATRFVFDFGNYDKRPSVAGLEYLSQWYTLGRDYGLHDSEWKMIGGAASADSVLVSSEPLTRDVSTWIEVPEYSALCVSQRAGKRQAFVVPLDV